MINYRPYLFTLTFISAFLSLLCLGCKKDRCSCGFDDWIGKYTLVDMSLNETFDNTHLMPWLPQETKHMYVENGKVITCHFKITDINSIDLTYKTVTLCDTTDFVPREISIFEVSEESVTIRTRKYVVTKGANYVGNASVYSWFQDYWQIEGKYLVHHFAHPKSNGRADYHYSEKYERINLVP